MVSKVTANASFVNICFAVRKPQADIYVLTSQNPDIFSIKSLMAI